LGALLAEQSVLLRFDTGARGSLRVGQVLPGHKNDLQIELNGRFGSLRWEQERQNELWLGFHDRPNGLVSKDPSLLTQEAAVYAHLPGGHQESWADAFRNVISDIYDCVRDRSAKPATLCTFADAYRTSAIVDAMLQSAGAGCRWIAVNPDLRSGMTLQSHASLRFRETALKKSKKLCFVSSHPVRLGAIVILNRRRFLSLTGTSAAALILPTFRVALAEPLGLPAGIQLYAVRDELAKDTPGTLKALHDIGFREVESAGFGKYTAAEFRKLIVDAGLSCPSAHLPFTGASDLTPIFADANAIGAHFAVSSVFINLFPNGRPTKPLDQVEPIPALGLDSFKKMAEHMNAVGKEAKTAGLQYAYHNHNFEFEKMPDGSYGYDVLLNETDHDLVKFEIDCGWMTVAGASPQAYFKRHPGRFRMLHVKDFRPIKPTTNLIGPGRPTGVELGHGFIDYRSIFAAAKKNAGIVHVFAEQEAPYQQGQLASAKASYDFLHSFA
jgi:sugar phosphate isomerase/epimerase